MKGALPEDSGPPASLDRLKAEAVPTPPESAAWAAWKLAVASAARLWPPPKTRVFASLESSPPWSTSRQGKYVTFLVEVRDGADATVARRLRERGGPPDPGDESLISVEWVAVADAVRDEWCRRRVARHHLHALRLLWPHLRALQEAAEAAEAAHGGAKGGEGGGRGDGSTAGGPCCASEAPLEGASTSAGTSSASTSTTSVEGGRPDDLAEVMGRVSLAS